MIILLGLYFGIWEQSFSYAEDLLPWDIFQKQNYQVNGFALKVWTNIDCQNTFQEAYINLYFSFTAKGYQLEEYHVKVFSHNLDEFF